MSDDAGPGPSTGGPAPAPADPQAAYAILDLEPGASLEAVEKAWRYHRALYDEAALATYSLLDPQERRAARDRVDAAYSALRARAAASPAGLLADRAPRESSLRAAPQRLPEPVTGAALRRFREERGVDLRHIAKVSRVPLRTLEDIEADRVARLPPPVYLRGFLVEYAREVGLDPAATAAAFLGTLPR